MSGMRDSSIFIKFAKCLESLPNLHTLEMGRIDCYPTPPLENALGRLKLPQVKALIVPPHVYPLLRNCRNVEDVACVFEGGGVIYFNEFCESLISNPDSKVKRLAIPLISCKDPSSK